MRDAFTIKIRLRFVYCLLLFLEVLVSQDEFDTRTCGEFEPVSLPRLEFEVRTHDGAFCLKA